MSLSVTVDGEPVDLKIIQFSGGERQPRLGKLQGPLPSNHRHRAKIVAHLWSSDDIMDLLLVTNALYEHYPRIDIALICPYLPYARQDRVCVDGEANALRMICTLLARQSYSRIELWDVHNERATRRWLLGAVTYLQAADFVELLPIRRGQTMVVAPDAGARQRARQSAEVLNTCLLQAEKTRDPNTGQLGAPTIETTRHLGDVDLLVVDDICDGGRTFVNLAKVLRPLTNGKLYLYVTHGIFSAGYNDLRAAYDHIYVANIHPQAGAPADLVTIVGATSP